MREKFSITKLFKDEKVDVIVVRKYRVKTGQKIPARESTVGPQEENGIIYPGGETQFNFQIDWRNVQWENYMERIGIRELH